MSVICVTKSFEMAFLVTVSSTQYNTIKHTY